MSKIPYGISLTGQAPFASIWIEESLTKEAVIKLIASTPDLLKIIVELLPLAEDGYKRSCESGAHEDFLQEDKALLIKARELIKKATS